MINITKFLQDDKDFCSDGFGAAANARRRSALCQALKGVARKDQLDFARLRELTYTKLLAISVGILGNENDAEDAMIEVYLTIWNNAGKFDPLRGDVISWLYSICHSRSIDLLRRTKMWNRQDASFERCDSDSLGFEPDPQDLLEVIQDNRRARSALDSLSPIVRQVVELTFFEELSHQQIADQTHCALGTIKSHVRRSLVKLRAQLSPI
jgi:RNA polymerase sigma-70 factor (ECF subfamily)